MNIFFRVDASLQIGTGHLMRCLTLANKLKEQGATTTFICRHITESLKQLICKNVHLLVLLPRHEVTAMSESNPLAHAKWLGVTQAEDAQATMLAIGVSDCDWLIVDHYALDVRWESVLRQSVKNILVIDDIADRKHDCDVLLDQNYYVDMDSRYVDKVPKHCQLLLGSRYALLRPEFLTARQQAKMRSGVVKRILVFFGGVDADNYTGMTLSALQNIDLNGIAIDVVIGTQHPNREEILSICKVNNFACHIQTQHMAELMATADLAIGAGGSASWERCCVGLPALLVAFAKNQVNIAKSLDLLGASIYIGESKSKSISIIKNVVYSLLRNQDKVMALSRKAYLLVDGLGLSRVVGVISEK